MFLIVMPKDVSPISGEENLWIEAENIKVYNKIQTNLRQSVHTVETLSLVGYTDIEFTKMDSILTRFPHVKSFVSNYHVNPVW